MTASANTVLLSGGRVLTPSGVQEGDVLVEDGRIRDLDGRSIRSLLDHPDHRTVDVSGRLVMPAFVDAHVHLAATGFAAMGADLSQADSCEEALDLLGRHAEASDLSVVLGHSWDETRWPDQRRPTRQEVDRVVGDRPAYVSRVDVHSAVVSTALLRVLPGDVGWLSALPGWSEEGPVTRDSHHAVRGALQELLRSDREEAIRTALTAAAAAGIGAVHELGAPHLSLVEDFLTLDALTDEVAVDGRALPAVLRYWGQPGALDLAEELGCVGSAGDVCVDGAVGSRTAALHEPYADAPATRGHLYLDRVAVADHVVACTEAGLQAGFHTIGDRAVTETVEGFRLAAQRIGDDAVRDARHRVEHLEMVTPDQVRVLAELGVTASVQPLFDGWWGGPGGLYEQRLGERARGMNPFATMLDVGLPLAFGSDSPVTPLDPWSAVRAATHHHDASGRIPMPAALAAHTTGGWAAARSGGGLLQPGAVATLAVWDVPTADPDGLPDLTDPNRLPRCVLTLVEGRVAYEEDQ